MTFQYIRRRKHIPHPTNPFGAEYICVRGVWVPKGLLRVERWLLKHEPEALPKFLENVNKADKRLWKINKKGSSVEQLYNAFGWDHTPEGYNFWDELAERMI